MATLVTFLLIAAGLSTLIFLMWFLIGKENWPIKPFAISLIITLIMLMVCGIPSYETQITEIADYTLTKGTKVVLLEVEDRSITLNTIEAFNLCDKPRTVKKIVKKNAFGGINSIYYKLVEKSKNNMEEADKL